MASYFVVAADVEIADFALIMHPRPVVLSRPVFDEVGVVAFDGEVEDDDAFGPLVVSVGDDPQRGAVGLADAVADDEVGGTDPALGFDKVRVFVGAVDDLDVAVLALQRDGLQVVGDVLEDVGDAFEFQRGGGSFSSLDQTRSPTRMSSMFYQRADPRRTCARAAPAGVGSILVASIFVLFACGPRGGHIKSATPGKE